MGTLDTHHIKILLSVIGIPAGAVIVMAFIEALGDKDTGPREHMAKLAWDLDVLAIGCVSGLFAEDSWGKAIRTELRSLYEVLLIFAIICMGCLIMSVRKRKPFRARHALAALMLGGAAFAVPMFLSIRY